MLFMEDAWWKRFFDLDYLRIWGASISEEQSDSEAAGLWDLLELQPGDRILDAPCGYGRLSRRLAERGARVLGVDQSKELLREAELRRGGLSTDLLEYRRHDLREPLLPGGFEAAVNIFSSIGYGTEAEDLAIVSNLGRALRPGGIFFLETNHRDAVVAYLSHTPKPALRLPDGTLVVEEPQFDPIRGRIETTWYWSGPAGQGRKEASLRVYTASELVALIRKAGLESISAHQGCSRKPFVFEGEKAGGRLGLLSRRPSDS